MTKQILLIDDDDATRDMICMILREEDCEIVAVATLREALAEISVRAFNLILADSLILNINEPYESLNLIKEASPTTSIVIVTAHNQEVYHDYAERGFRALLSKPFRINTLINIVEQFCDDTGFYNLEHADARHVSI